MLNLRNTDAIRTILATATKENRLSPELRKQASDLLGEDAVPWRPVHQICCELRKLDDKPVTDSTPSTTPVNKEKENAPWFNDVCIGSGLDLHPPPKRKKSPELEKRLEKLQRELDERGYRNMVKDVAQAEFDAEEDRELLSTGRLQFSFGAHVALTMAVFFLLGQYGTRAISDSPTIQALGGCLGLTFALFMETTLWMIRSQPPKARKFSRAYAMERREDVKGGEIGESLGDKKNQ